MSPTDLARRIDHTILKPESTAPEVHRVVAEAMQYGFAAVCVAPIWIARVATMLRGSGVRTCAVVSFPHGASKPTIKAIEATSAIKDGADEIDVVAHLPHLAKADLDASRAELLEIVRAARAAACRAVRESGCDFIKTSTGFHPSGGATLDALRLMKKHADSLLIKAS